MGERANTFFPFALAVILPPVGVILGLLSMREGERDLGVRLIVVALLAAVVWALLILA